MSSAKQRIFVYGNCQGGWFAQVLKLQPAVTARFEITYLANFGERPSHHPINDPGFLPSCSVVIWQTASGCAPPDFVGSLAPECRQIRFPTLSLKLLWPLHTSDPRSVPETGFPYGRYPYGDRLLTRLMEQGVTGAELLQRYADTNLNTIINLDRFTEMALAELRFNDRQSDFAITPYIEKSFRENRLFHTVNHPAFAILFHLYQAIESSLLGLPIRDKGDILLPPDALDVLGEIQIPLHPQIVSHFKLSWILPATKWRYNSAILSLEEYVRAYVEFTPIPLAAPPQVWLERAQQADSQNNLPEARRILLEATSYFPTLHHFLQYLGTLLIGAGQLLEAEKTLRYAISRHPQVASLHNNLGVLMLRQNFASEAVRLFSEVLRIDPHFKDARRNLLLAGQRLRTPTRPSRPFSSLPS